MKTILIPTDFSDSAFNAVRFAVKLAEQFQSDLHLLNVYHIPNPLQTLPLEIIITPDELKRDTDSQLKKTLKLIQEINPTNLHVELASRNGFTEKEITDYANFIHADLIVMGMHGAGEIREKLIGSTTTSLIRNSHIPVLVIPQHAVFNPIEQIIFASDGKDIHEQSRLDVLLEIAKKFKSEISILSILSPRDYSEKDTIIEVLDRSFMNVRHSYYFPETNDISLGIHDFINQSHAQLLVMIPRKHGFFKTLFTEHHTTRLAFHSEIPLLAIDDES